MRSGWPIPTRPVFLNLGQGVAWDLDRPYVGRGSDCAQRWDPYPEYARGADILSFDIYPVTSPYAHIQGELWWVALGVDRLREWAGPGRIRAAYAWRGGRRVRNRDGIGRGPRD